MGNSSSNELKDDNNDNLILNIQPDILDIRDYIFKLPENQIVEFSENYKINLYDNIKLEVNNSLINNICFIIYNQIKNMNDNIELIYPSAKYLEYIVNSNIDYQNLSMKYFQINKSIWILPVLYKHIINIK